LIPTRRLAAVTNRAARQNDYVRADAASRCRFACAVHDAQWCASDSGAAASDFRMCSCPHAAHAAHALRRRALRRSSASLACVEFARVKDDRGQYAA
jgi:hypothetical protein